MITKGKWRGERVSKDGEEAFCIWQPFFEGDEEMGYCIDFRPEDRPDLIALLQELENAPVTELEVDVEVEGEGDGEPSET